MSAFSNEILRSAASILAVLCPSQLIIVGQFHSSGYFETLQPGLCATCNPVQCSIYCSVYCSVQYSLSYLVYQARRPYPVWSNFKLMHLAAVHLFTSGFPGSSSRSVQLPTQNFQAISLELSELLIFFVLQFKTLFARLYGRTHWSNALVERREIQKILLVIQKDILLRNADRKISF